jgi:predicted RNA-binding protein YlxR (DUF448 family)
MKRNINNAGILPARHIAQRTCIACRQIKAKHEMVRLVCTPQGVIEIDITGKKEGRGAYFCPTGECLEKTLVSKQIEHILKGHLTQENREQLKRSGREFLKELIGKNQ